MYLGQRSATRLAVKTGIELPENYQYPHADMCTMKHDIHALLGRQEDMGNVQSDDDAELRAALAMSVAEGAEGAAGSGDRGGQEEKAKLAEAKAGAEAPERIPPAEEPADALTLLHDIGHDQPFHVDNLPHVTPPSPHHRLR